MAITSGYFNSVNGDRKYNADQMSEYFEGIINEGVCQHIDGGLAVTAGTGLSVNVAAGKAFIGKKWIRNDASLTLTISAASASYARIDAVVLRRNNTTRTCQIVVKSGTPAASPAAPTMTRNSTTYEMALAYVNVAANATSVTVTDKRADTTVCGWATVAESVPGEIDAMLNDMKTGFDGVVYPSPAAMVQGEDQKLFAKSVIERKATSGNYTDFNDIVDNGVYLVNSNLANGVNGASSTNYAGFLIVTTWDHTNARFGPVQIFVSNAGLYYFRWRWETWGTWNILLNKNKIFCVTEQQTNSVYTDFDSITTIGCYLVNSALTNGPSSSESTSYMGILEVVKWQDNSPYAMKQIYTSSSGNQYYRIYWGSSWGEWISVASGDTMDQVIHSVNILNPETFINRGYYYDFNDGVTHITSSSSKMSDKIPVSDGVVYIRQNFSDTSNNLVLIYCYDENDTYLGYFYKSFRDIGLNSEWKLKLYSTTAKIIVYTNNQTVSGSNICITDYSVDTIVDYGEEITLYPAPSMYVHDKLYKVTIANFGDSIFGNKRPPSDISTAIADMTGATVYNLGFGGCRMSSNTANWDAFSMYQLAYAIANDDFSVQDAVDIDASGLPSYFKETRTLLESIDFSKVDIITISYGTNDFTAEVPLSSSDPYSTSTFEGALRYSLELLLTAYPQLKIYVCTPTYRFWMEGGVFTEDSDTKVIAGQKLTDFVESVQTISKEYHLKSIDNYYKLGINKFNRTNWFPSGDGTHHNEKGGELIAQNMVNEMF